MMEIFDESKREVSGFVPLKPGFILTNPSTGEVIRTIEEQRADFERGQAEAERFKGRLDLPTTEDVLRDINSEPRTGILGEMTVIFNKDTPTDPLHG